ncbi:MAG: NAD(P)H-dependent oxidoreductase subunit E, partial [Treponema sp.]|nr:NAD(P)H-dependent oxidoreductase subunit E [Treponema sp.]
MAYKNYILVCGGTACESNKGAEIFEKLIEEADKQGVKAEVQIVKTGCFGFCEKGPIVKVLPEDSFYVDVVPEDAREIIAEHILKGREVKRLLYKDDDHKKAVNAVEDIQFYQKQFRVVLRNCGAIDPEKIDEYIAREGYSGLEKVLFDWNQEQLINEVKISGLRGRGGAGFPTWLKWDLARKAVGDVKYVICNADEGDPGAYMDRSTIEGDPHSVIEGMITAGKAIGANQGFVYIRAEYPLAIERLKIALEQAKDYGLLGKNILGSGFDFDIEIRLGAGAFVCGEETALIKSVEGNRGMPVPKPPFPANKGLWEKPTVINNVETLANIPVITARGGAWLAKLGTEKSKGTKVFALTGKVKSSGLVEVPMGTTLREI